MKAIETLLKKYRAEELAIKFDCSAAIIAKWKNGSRNPSRQNKAKIDALLAEN